MPRNNGLRGIQIFVTLLRFLRIVVIVA